MGVAIYAKRYHANLSAKRAAVDFILAAEANAPLASARKRFAQSSNKGPQHLEGLLDAVQADEASPDQWGEYGDVIAYLNHCELVAVAIKDGAMDETMYQRFNQSAYVQAWNRAQEFIRTARNRKTQPTLFEHFEGLATKWQK